MLTSAQIAGMSVTERLQAMELLWDALQRDEAAVASPEWHRQVLAERRARVQRGEAEFLTLAQLRLRLRAGKA